MEAWIAHNQNLERRRSLNTKSVKLTALYKIQTSALKSSIPSSTLWIWVALLERLWNALVTKKISILTSERSLATKKMTIVRASSNPCKVSVRTVILPAKSLKEPSSPPDLPPSARNLRKIWTKLTISYTQVSLKVILSIDRLQAVACTTRFAKSRLSCLRYWVI